MAKNVVDSAAGSALFKVGRRRPVLFRAFTCRAASGKLTRRALLTWATSGAVPRCGGGRRVAATQFHPEKSGDAGAAVLSNWVDGL